MSAHIWRAAALSFGALLISGTARAGEPHTVGFTGGASTMTLGLNLGDDGEDVEVFHRRFYGPRVSFYYPSYRYSYRYSYFPRAYSYGYRYRYPTYRYYSYSYPRFYAPRYSYGAYYYFSGGDPSCGASTLTLDLRTPAVTEEPSTTPTPFERMPAAQDAPAVPATPEPAEEGTFPYDGGPAQPVPMPPMELKPAPTVPDAEALRVSMPAKKKYRFRAYGEK